LEDKKYGRNEQRPSEILTSAKTAQAMIDRFLRNYKDPNRFLDIFPSFKKRVNVLSGPDEIKVRPRNLEDEYFKKNELLKYYLMRDNRMMAFLDNGSKIKERENLEIFWEVSTRANNKELQTVTHIWVFHTKGGE
jgi:hypothetical protein